MNALRKVRAWFDALALWDARRREFNHLRYLKKNRVILPRPSPLCERNKTQCI